MLQLDVQNGRLQLIDAEIAANERVEVFGLAAVDAQDFHPLRQGGIIGHAHARIAECAEILGREKRQAAHVTIAAGAAAVRIVCADRLSGVLDDAQAVRLGNFHEGRHVSHLSVQMHRHDGLDALAFAAVKAVAAALAVRLDERLDRGRRQVEGRRVDVAEQRA